MCGLSYFNTLKQFSKAFGIGKWHTDKKLALVLKVRMFFDDEWQLPLTSIITTPQENNHTVDFKIILICIVWYLYIFMMETSHFYTPDCSQTIFQANQYRPTTDHRNLVSSYHLISPSLLPPQHKMNEKKKSQHFIESIHESILLSGKQCTWMKVNDFPASPSNQYSLYKLMLLLNVR